MNRTLNLFKPLVEEEKLHPNFKNVFHDNLPYVREVLLNWSNGFHDRDGKFVYEFQTTFNSSFWELYLFSVLKELNLEVDFTKNRPDFVIKGNKPFCIEATIASHPFNGQPEWIKNIDEDMKKWTTDKVIDNATIRLANSFISKSRYYQSSYSKLDYTKDLPYVIAIAPFDSPYFFVQNHQAIRRVLYGFDRFVAIDWNENERDIIEEITMESIEKKKDIEIPLGYFNDEQHSHVSAVIFSSVATAGKARMISDDPRIVLSKSKRYNDFGTQPIYEVLEKREANEQLLDGLIVFHNPFAKHPFNIEEFYHPLIAHADNRISDLPHKTLLQREVLTLNKTERLSSASRKKIEMRYKKKLSESDDLNFPIVHK
ncbi:hypothetical protein [Heyndrickxia oleronia]|uniref:hypothetical protein n=1 Tax=Heyndrickxia oleronia TaxID=38875 RepID=UPI001B26CEA7|nr:hypothetical protein [Heyndrickxia oleronia]GIN38474.1 hypothetical protein J19TS1_14230 [Heyndrickxia oleronia]